MHEHCWYSVESMAGRTTKSRKFVVMSHALKSGFHGCHANFDSFQQKLAIWFLCASLPEIIRTGI
jgi:hypothetical protein